MTDLLITLLAIIGAAVVAYAAGSCIADMFRNVPDHLPPPREDSRDTRRAWDRIWGR